MNSEARDRSNTNDSWYIHDIAFEHVTLSVNLPRLVRSSDIGNEFDTATFTQR